MPSCSSRSTRRSSSKRSKVCARLAGESRRVACERCGPPMVSTVSRSLDALPDVALVAAEPDVLLHVERGEAEQPRGLRRDHLLHEPERLGLLVEELLEAAAAAVEA